MGSLDLLVSCRRLFLAGAERHGALRGALIYCGPGEVAHLDALPVGAADLDENVLGRRGDGAVWSIRLGATGWPDWVRLADEAGAILRRVRPAGLPVEVFRFRGVRPTWLAAVAHLTGAERRTWDDSRLAVPWQSERLRALSRIAPGMVALPTDRPTNHWLVEFADVWTASADAIEVLAEPATGGAQPQGAASHNAP